MKVFLVLLAGLFLAGLLGINESFAATASHTTRTDTGGGVTVKVTYLNPQGTEDARFEISLDTHSVDLDS